MTTYYAVCDASGPISVELEGKTVAEAVQAFNRLDAREAIDDARTDLEDELEIDGYGMSESEFTESLQKMGATPVKPLGDVDQQGRSVAGSWHLWAVE